MVYQGGYTGEYYPAPEESPRYSEAGPGSPNGAGVGGIWGSDVHGVTVGTGTVISHPAGPVGHPCPPWI